MPHRDSEDVGNLIRPGMPDSGGALPTGWEAICPNPALAPRFGSGRTGEGALCLTAQGNGRRECFGYLHRAVSLQASKTYCLRVRLQTEGLQDLNRHLVHGVLGEGFNNLILSYRREDGAIVGEERFPGPDRDLEAEIRLYYRFSANGRVQWEHVSLEECAPIPPRLVKVACSWGQGDLAHWEAWLDRAGEKGVDVALLPEVFNGKPVAQPEPLDGPSGALLARKARQWKMYVSGSFYERRGDLTLNTAPLYDRSGNLVGTYSKNQLYDPEEDEGATPGVGFPVFETDLGRVGIIICYDSWFPETTRLLAYKGTELVLFPNAGYFAGLMPARAADNGVWIAVSSLDGPAGVWDPGGHRAGEMHADPTLYAPCSIQAYEKDDALRMVTATVDLSMHPSPHSWGGPLRSAPGGRRCRQTLIEPIEDEITREAQRWEDD
jgi:predicted amidohydrolase